MGQRAKLGWITARLALIGLVLAGAALAVILAAGAANPPLAGPLCVEHVNPAPETTITLPPPPYTLLIDGAISGEWRAWWGIAIDASPPVRITITADAYFRVEPVLTDATSFFHIRPPGQNNQLYLDVRRSGQAELRINEEIAWQGTFTQLGAARSAHLVSGDGALRLARLRIYCGTTG